MITIPNGSIEIQTGLWAYLHEYTVSGVTRAYYELFSAEGYCFWEVNQPENYDDDGNLKPESERIYACYATLAQCYTTIEQINTDFISVPIQEGFEIVNISPNTDTV